MQQLPRQSSGNEINFSMKKTGVMQQKMKRRKIVQGMNGHINDITISSTK